jgi:TRAP-type uncharacterized transport system fused permease subunit
MGMPIAPTYIMLVILIAPALVEIGIDALAAHLFINFFGAMSFVTPPVCIAAFVAAGIAGSRPMRVGFTAARLGIAAYVVPFAFCYSSGLLLKGSPGHIVWAVAHTSLGVIVLAIGLSGYLFTNLNPMKRIVFILGGLMLMTPQPLFIGIGFLACLCLFLWDFWWKKAEDRKQEQLQLHRIPLDSEDREVVKL